MQNQRSSIRSLAQCGVLVLFLAGLTANAWAGICGNGKCNVKRGETADNCPVDCGDGEPPPDDGGTDSGTDLRLSCLFLDEYGKGDNVLSDEYGAYVDGVDNVACSTGGTTQPNLSGIGLDASAKGKFKPGDRLLDLAFTQCNEADCYDIAGASDDDEDGVLNDGLPASIFEATPVVGEKFWMTVRPYRDGQGHIQELPVGPYGMAVRFNLKQSARGPRIVMSLAERDIRGDKFQGTLCDLGDGGTDVTLDRDALVIVSESTESRFIVTTVDGVNDTGENGDGGFMKAAICSNIPPADASACEGADDSGLCNFHGFVNVRFTLAADVLP
jgi:hypothetical protein